MNDSADDKLSAKLDILLEVCKDEISDQNARNRDFGIKTAGCLALNLALINAIDFTNTLTIAIVGLEFILGIFFAGKVLIPSEWFRPFSPDGVVEYEKLYQSADADMLVNKLLQGYSKAIEKNRVKLSHKATYLSRLYKITFIQIITCLFLHFIIFF